MSIVTGFRHEVAFPSCRLVLEGPPPTVFPIVMVCLPVAWYHASRLSPLSDQTFAAVSPKHFFFLGPSHLAFVRAWTGLADGGNCEPLPQPVPPDTIARLNDLNHFPSVRPVTGSDAVNFFPLSSPKPKTDGPGLLHVPTRRDGMLPSYVLDTQPLVVAAGKRLYSSPVEEMASAPASRNTGALTPFPKPFFHLFTPGAFIAS